MNVVMEGAKEIPVAYKSQVIVAGAGPAGVMAAVAAARAGAEVLLIERVNCAGGIWTSGLLSWMLDVTGKEGLLRELMNRLKSEGEGDFARAGNFISFPEAVKRVLDDMLIAAGVQVLYYTSVAGVLKCASRIRFVILESKAGRQAAEGDVFIDATGDGDLSAYAGCRHEIGKDPSAITQPASLIAIMTGVHAEDVRSCNNTLEYLDKAENAKACLKREMQRAGIVPSYSAPSLFHIKDDIWLVMTTHSYGIDALSPASLTRATMESRMELHRQEQAMRALGGAWEKMRIVSTAPYLGIRECRRVAGKYRVTLEDALCGRKHEDAVCRVNFSLDVHPLKPDRTFEDETGKMHTQPYDIPLRALESADVENLLLAGRLISGDFFAHSSYRVSGDAAAIGEAAGIEAARRTKEELAK